MAKTNDGIAQDDTGLDLSDLAKTLGGEDGAGGDADAGESLDKAETAARLRACAARMAKTHTFVPGQLIQWKKGLKNKRTPAYGEPVIVTEVLPERLIDETQDGAGSPYFREPLTLIAGELDSDGDFVCFHYDGRRFEPYKE